MAELKHGFTCYWRIENFYIDKNTPDCLLKSQTFDVFMLRDSTWHLELQQTYSKSLGLFLFKDGLAGNSNIDLEMSILMSNRSWKLCKFGLCKGFNPTGEGKGAPILIKWNKHTALETFVLNGNLVVSCHMSNGSTRNIYEQYVMTSRMISNHRIVHGSLHKFTTLRPGDILNLSGYKNPVLFPFSADKSVNFKSTQTESMEDDNKFNDLEDLLKLFKDKKFRYVTLRTTSKDFVVHKALLCARSPVFNAMFQGRMKENESNIVDIHDINDETLSLLVQFLHLEPISDLGWDEAVELYYAADKYQIELLKKECCSFLTQDLSVENICEAFIFADKHNDKGLQQSAQEYFCKNSKTILRSTEWTDFLFYRTDLASEILVKLAENL